MAPIWLTALIDLPPSAYDAGVAFWRGITGYELSESSGERDEFAKLLPPDGDPSLGVQRLDDGPPGVHIDIHWPGQEFEVRRSPGGFAYCAVSEELSVRTPPTTWPGGHRSIVDQVCLDIPPRLYEAECEFWCDLTGWELRQSRDHPEFHSLVRPEGQPIRLLLQRVGDDRPRVTAHLDLSCDDRAAETRRHEELGARVLRTHDHFTVLVDPTGAEYCITDRHPDSGVLA